MTRFHSQPLPGTSPVTIVDATDNQCHWPVDAPEASNLPHVCGCKTSKGMYCHQHHALLIGPGTEGERSAHRDLVYFGRAA